jgi:phage tail sheath protein FI
MPVYLTPGVYIEEIPSGARPIESAATSVAAFVGPAVRGPAAAASRIGMLSDYKALYGDIASETDDMGLAVQAFYLNGGKTAYICRLAGAGSAAASLSLVGQGTGGTPTTNPVLIFTASSVGAWGGDLYIMIEKPDPEALTFDVMIGRQVDGTFEADETFTDLTMREGSDGYVISVLNDLSLLVDVALGDDAAIDEATADYQEATLQGGDTGGVATYFSAALAGAAIGTLSLNLNNRGQEVISIDLSGAVFGGIDHNLDADALRTAVEAGIHAHSPLDVYQNVTVAFSGQRFEVTSPRDNSNASLAVSGGTLGDLMRMTSDDRTVLTGGAMGAGITVFSAAATGAFATDPTDIAISIDGHGPFTASVEYVGLPFVRVNVDDGELVAAALETAIRAAAPDLPSFAAATVAYDGARSFVITSGNSAPQNSLLAVEVGDFADFLNLPTGATVTGREINQGVGPVIPVQTLGPGGEGTQLTGGVSIAPSAADYADFYGNVLRKVRDVTMILLPGAPYNPDGPSLAISNTLAFAESRKQMMVILDPPRNTELATDQAIDDFMPATSTYASMYYPWVVSPNPLYNVDLNPTADKTVLIPPSAYAAGIWTKTDGRRGIWKAPAGVETRLIGATSLEYEVEDTEQSVLNPRGVNCFRKMPSYGPVIWGARTLATKAVPEWRYVPVRRTALFIEKSIQDGIQWAVFQPNAHPLWASLRANIGGFMDGLFRAGAFQGEKANDAYFVRCNLGDTMTQADIDRGQVIAVVGFAPLKPAEFVIVRIQQKVGEE